MEADAYCNAVSVLEELRFSREECEAVIASMRLRKAAGERDLPPPPSVVGVARDRSWRVPEDWARVGRGKLLRVDSWLPHVGSWGTFDVKKAYSSWRMDRTDESDGVPSVAQLRAHGYFLRFFPDLAETTLERGRLIEFLRSPSSALAQYLVQHCEFWAQNPNRIDEAHGFRMRPLPRMYLSVIMYSGVC